MHCTMHNRRVNLIYISHITRLHYVSPLWIQNASLTQRINFVGRKEIKAHKRIRSSSLLAQTSTTPPPPPNVRSLKLLHLAAAAFLLHLLASKRNTGLGGRRHTGLVLHPRLDLTGHGQECLLDVRRSLSGSLQKLDTKSIGKLLALLR